MKAKIYALIDPINNEIKWVGKTIMKLNDRLNSHIQNSRFEKYKIGCKKWIQSLLKNNKKPIIKLIEETDNYIEREKYWIKYYKNLGYSLTNISPGGDNNKGFKVSPETLIKMSNAVKGIKRGHPTKEHKLKISQKAKGRIISIEQREKISKSLIGFKHSEETKQKLKIAKKNISNETRKKLSIAAKLDWMKRKSKK